MKLGKKPRPMRKHNNNEVARLLREWSRLEFDHDGVLLWKNAHNNQIVLPSSCHWMIFQELHEEMGHLGAERVYQLAKKRVYWPRMEDDITHYISSKCSCVARKNKHGESGTSWHDCLNSTNGHSWH